MGTGEAKYKNGNVYEGKIKNGKMVGEGSYVWTDGTRFQGSFVKNSINGKGTFTWPDGSTYTGDVKDGLRHGHGRYTNTQAGYTYEGQWKRGLRDGEGTLTYGGGTKSSGYRGSWAKGVKEGYGEYRYGSGNVYKGEWRGNKKHGSGSMFWYYPNTVVLREKYVGNWENDRQNGFGTHIWMEEKGESRVLRNRYVGHWKDGVREGWGMFFYANGGVYKGEWKGGLKHGVGKMVHENGEEYSGEFAKDRMVDRTLDGTVKASGESDKLQSKYYATERARFEVEGNPYDAMIDVSDIICLEQLENLSQPTAVLEYVRKYERIPSAINKLLLQHNTQLKRWYKHYSREIDCPQMEEGFVLVSSQLWRLFRDAKAPCLNFSLAEFDRVYAQGSRAKFSLKYDPLLGVEKEIIPINSKELSSMEGRKDSIDCSNIAPNELAIAHEENFIEESFSDETDIHSGMRPMLFRHFAEAIVRASFVYYQDSDASLKDKLEKFLSEKLTPRLSEVMSKDSLIEPASSLSFKFENVFNGVDKKLFEVFKLHSLNTNEKIFDYTISANTFIEMAAKVLDELKMEKVDLVELLERDFDPPCKADAILANEDLAEEDKNEQYEEHVKGLLKKELIYYEFKELIAELASCCNKDEDYLKEFVNHWIRINSVKEVRRQVRPRRKWIPTEKETL